MDLIDAERASPIPSTPPEYCPDCDGRLQAVDPPAVQRCGDCGEYEFFDPIPTAQVAVLDGDAVLLVTVDLPERNRSGKPGR